MLQPLCSVIIPCYNQASYLTAALDSVLAQTSVDWEAIVVDDGSSDGTSEVAAAYAARDRRIRPLRQDNQGLAGARNTGIGAARGAYLAFLDADDAWEPEFLATCVETLEARADLLGVYTRNLHIDGAGNQLPMPGGQVFAPDRLYSRLLQGGFFPPCAVVVRTEAVRAAGLFDGQLDGRGTEDWDLWLRLAARGGLAGIDRPLARYRVQTGSMSTDAEPMHRNRMAVLAKHLGPPDGEPAQWSNDKRRAYGHALRATALGHIAQGDPQQGWLMLGRAAELWPEILTQLDTCYELACWDQPRGYRGQAASLDLERNAGQVIAGLDGLFEQGGDALAKLRRPAYAQAYHALAMLADQAGNWGLARRYLWRAMGYYPRLALEPGVRRRLAKLCAGQWLVGQARRVWGAAHRAGGGGAREFCC